MQPTKIVELMSSIELFQELDTTEKEVLDFPS